MGEGTGNKSRNHGRNKSGRVINSGCINLA